MQNFLRFLSLPLRFTVKAAGQRFITQPPPARSLDLSRASPFLLELTDYRLQAGGLPPPPFPPTTSTSLPPTTFPHVHSSVPQVHRPLFQSGTICTSGSSSGKSLKLIYNCSRTDAQMERGGGEGWGQRGRWADVTCQNCLQA